MQIAAGLKIWAVQYESDRVYHFKSDMALKPAQHVVTRGKNGIFLVGRVKEQVTEVDFSEDMEFGWILGMVADPIEVEIRCDAIDKNAAKKIAESRLKAEAMQIAKTAGMSIEDFAIAKLEAPQVASDSGE